METNAAHTCLQEARAFFEAWTAHPEAHPPSEPEMRRRLETVEREIASTGTYTHTPEELEFGARLAWKNSNRCIGRHLWRSLEVRDCRNLHAEKDREQRVTDSLKSHLSDAYRGGKIKSIISIFAARTPGKPDPVRMANHQLIRYAGFPSPNGTIGDPHSAEQTAHFLEAGWQPVARNAFTKLPWQFFWDGLPGRTLDVLADHPELAREVELVHPENAAFAQLNLRWYALPVLADMALKIGGVVYPFAPFNGYYMGTEIGARNLGDAARYDRLADVARCFGWDTGDVRSLWRDRALVELNRAVLHSFDAAGITVGDHHQLGAQFEAFCQFESQRGREITGDWGWLTPPISGSSTPQFHRDFDNHVAAHTNFFYQTPVWQKAVKSSSGCPFHL